MQSKVSLLVLFSLIFIFVSCTEPEDQDIFILSGTLSSESGEPQSNVEVHIRNYLAPNGFVEPEGTEYNSNLSFTVQEAAQTLVIVFKYAKDEVLATLVDEELEPGNYTVEFPSELMSNGVYGYNIQVGEAASTGFFVVNRSDSSLFGIQPFTHTDENGAFSFPIRELGIGELFSSGETQIFIEDSLMIIGIKDGEILGKAKLQVDANRDNEVGLILN